jgi:hypothetical protein
MPRRKTPRPPAPLPTLHPAQQAVFDSRARFRVVVCGRRWGKTELGKALVLARLSAGDQRVWWLAPTRTMASQVWRDLKRHLDQRDDLSIDVSERHVEFDAGGWLDIRSTHTPDYLRGAGLDFAVMDEAAFMKPTVWPEVVRPMLLDRRGGALFISTPNGHNWFYDVYRHALEDPEWATFHYPTSSSPLIDPADLAAIRASTIERIWRQEYEAEFIDGSGQVFRHLREAATASPSAPECVVHAVAGVDWGREGDYTAVVVLDAETRTMLDIDRFHQVGWELQRSRLTALCARWNVQTVLAEANSIGSVNIEALERDGLPIVPFTMTSRSKPPLIDALALALETGQLRLLPDEVLLHELAAYRMRRSPSGLWQYSAPSGGHDDCVIALALAWRAAQQPTVRLDFA